MNPAFNLHSVPRMLRTISHLVEDRDIRTQMLVDLSLSREALELAYQAAMAYGREQHHRAEHLASVYTETATSLQAEIQRSQALEAELAEVRENFAAARKVDSRDARLRSFG